LESAETGDIIILRNVQTLNLIILVLVFLSEEAIEAIGRGEKSILATDQNFNIFLRLAILTFCETGLLSPIVVIAILPVKTIFSLLTADQDPDKKGGFDENWYEANSMVIPALLCFLLILNHILIPMLYYAWYKRQ